jgi:Uma2 family endonuclease
MRDQLVAYKLTHRGQVYGIAAGTECKLLIGELESERHPDLSIYKTPPPPGDDVWSTWMPEIVIEIVSPSSEDRDYEEKREEYLLLGIKEYWIVDVERREMLVLRRSRGRWAKQTVRPSEVCRTRLLPDFELALAPIFEAADAVRD